MARFDRYVLSLMLAVFGFFTFVLVAVYWVNLAVRLFEQLIADGQTAAVFLEFSLLSLPNVIRLVVPVAAFVATLYATNRLANESELVVMQATGFSPARLARPVAYFGLIVALIMAVLVHWLVPVSRAELADRRDAIERNVVSGLLVEGAFVNPVPGVTLYAREITELGELRQTLLSDNRRAPTRADYFAERAFIVADAGAASLVLVDGVAMVARPDATLELTRFDDLTFEVAGPAESGARQVTEIREMSSLRLLAAARADLDTTGATRAQFLRDVHERMSHPLLAGVLPVMAFAILILGGFSRMGLVPQIALAILVSMVLQLMSNAAVDVSMRAITAWPVIYLAPVLGVFLTVATLWFGTRPRRVAA